MATTTRFTGFCPCCTGTFKVRDEKLVHHGYQRPGFGFIVGDCFGALQTPHELSQKTAERYADFLQDNLHQTRGQLAQLPGRTELPYGKKTVTKAEAPEGGYDWDGDREATLALYNAVQAWDRAYKSMESKLRGRLEGLAQEIERVNGLIETWTEKTLGTVEEQVRKAAAEKAERAARKAQTRQDKIDAQVQKYQKRIDTALRTKRGSTLAQIWEGAQRKLRDIDPSLTQEEALALLDRDHVWEAFGLGGLTLSGYRTPIGERPEWAPLRAMDEADKKSWPEAL